MESYVMFAFLTKCFLSPSSVMIWTTIVRLLVGSPKNGNVYRRITGNVRALYWALPCCSSPAHSVACESGFSSLGKARFGQIWVYYVFVSSPALEDQITKTKKDEKRLLGQSKLLKSEMLPPFQDLLSSKDDVSPLMTELLAPKLEADSAVMKSNS